MANNKMLIDASHPEETRVVVLRGNRIEEFDFESASKKPLRGNIYLAKVTRVEPSLQAAFVEYGGNRHGFLAFSEIHPDYYQIPVADRQALLEDEARERRDEEDEEEARRTRPPQQQQQQQRRSRRFRKGGDRNAQRSARGDEIISEDAPQPGFEPSFDPAADHSQPQAHSEDSLQPGAIASDPQLNTNGGEQPPVETRDAPSSAAEATAEPAVYAPEAAISYLAPVEPAAPVVSAEPAQAEPAAEAGRDEAVAHTAAEPAPHGEDVQNAPHAEGSPIAAPAEDEHDDDDAEDGEDEEEEQVEQLGGDEFEEARPVRRTRRQYKIQEVIKRRQVLLIQVVKEERGNKGAALTTYLSLAGRYSVLMPNTARGGGISRKITDSDDRKRLREIAGALDVPEGMGVILRTAGAARGREEVQRDFEYLLRMWESVRELTLRSMAPALVYEEGSLIKRSIRDLYGKEIDEVIVAGGEGYREARDFMGMLMPTHVGNVREWKEQQPVFAKYGVEQQLDSMFSNIVTLKSGGYIVVNQTEALVAIDVNSGRSTREHNIEDTALRTNLEAADEVARQLRLRDLAGLIVVDFIDMEEYRNNRSVERRMKDALKNDRARIQVGRISHFGLLEMSRQRMRTGVLEGSSVPCPHCMGAGTVRSTASIALHVLRLIEDALIRNNQFNMTLRTRTEVALYILNQKRAHLRDLEERFGVFLTIAADDTLTGSNYHVIERGEPATPAIVPLQSRPQQIRVDSIAPVYDDEDPVAANDGDEGDDDEEAGDMASARAPAPEGETEGERDERRRRRRRRRGGRNRESSGIEADAPQPSDDGLGVVAEFAVIPAHPDAALEGSLIAGEDSGDDTGENGQPGGNRAAGGDFDNRSRRGNRRRRGRGGRDDFRPRNGQNDDQPPAGTWVRSSEDGEPAEAGNASQSASGTWSVAPEMPRHADQEAARETQSSDYASGYSENRPAESSAPAANDESRSYMSSAPVEAAAPVVPAAPAAEAPAPVQAAPEAAAPAAPAPEAPAPSAQAQADASAAEAAQAASARRPVETLPEAPPPQQKRAGWWQRARDALGG